MLFLEQSMVIFVNLTSVCTKLQNFCTELTISGLNKLKKKSFSFTFFCKNAVALMVIRIEQINQQFPSTDFLERVLIEFSFLVCH